MTGRVSAYNQVQRIADLVFNQTITTIGLTPVVVYTVPAGKKARITWLAYQMVTTGANSALNLKINSAILDTKSIADSVVQVPNIPANFVLQAGDVIKFDGDNAGNNGTVNLFLSVQELPA